MSVLYETQSIQYLEHDKLYQIRRKYQEGRKQTEYNNNINTYMCIAIATHFW